MVRNYLSNSNYILLVLEKFHFFLDILNNNKVFSDGILSLTIFFLLLGFLLLYFNIKN
jgi:hypothetical protein